MSLLCPYFSALSPNIQCLRILSFLLSRKCLILPCRSTYCQTTLRVPLRTDSWKRLHVEDAFRTIRCGNFEPSHLLPSSRTGREADWAKPQITQIFFSDERPLRAGAADRPSKSRSSASASALDRRESRIVDTCQRWSGPGQSIAGPSPSGGSGTARCRWSDGRSGFPEMESDAPPRGRKLGQGEAVNREGGRLSATLLYRPCRWHEKDRFLRSGGDAFSDVRLIGPAEEGFTEGGRGLGERGDGRRVRKEIED